MKKKHVRAGFGTRSAMTAPMTSPLANPDTTHRSNPNQAGSTLVSLVAARAGREVVWVLITGVFLLVEALIFLTELPTSRIFHRREAVKSAGVTRR